MVKAKSGRLAAFMQIASFLERDRMESFGGEYNLCVFSLEGRKEGALIAWWMFLHHASFLLYHLEFFCMCSPPL